MQPIHFNMEGYVAFLTHNEDHHDDVEFQSPFSNVTKISTVGVDPYRCEMLFKHDPDRNMSLYFRHELLPEPTEGMPVMGVCGCRAASMSSKNKHICGNNFSNCADRLHSCVFTLHHQREGTCLHLMKLCNTNH